jgi:hypothetical protein
MARTWTTSFDSGFVAGVAKSERGGGGWEGEDGSESVGLAKRAARRLEVPDRGGSFGGIEDEDVDERGLRGMESSVMGERRVVVGNRELEVVPIRVVGFTRPEIYLYKRVSIRVCGRQWSVPLELRLSVVEGSRRFRQ